MDVPEFARKAKSPFLFRGMWQCRGCLERAENCYCTPTPVQSADDDFWQDEARAEWNEMAHYGRQEIIDHNTGIIR